MHHTDWPVADPACSTATLLDDMAIGAHRGDAGPRHARQRQPKVRQPLARAVAVVAPEQREGLLRMNDLVADELNVKAVELAPTRPS